MSNVKLDDMMRKIQGLLAVADDQATPAAAADTYRAKAEQLMHDYRIQEEDLRARGELHVETITPGSKVVILCPYDSPYFNAYWNIAVYAAQHVGCRINSKWTSDPDTGQYVLAAVVVGFESDIRFMEVLFTNARIVFADRMEPKVKPELSDEENVYRLRSAGIERIKIAKMMGYGDTNSATAKVTNMYKRACKARGEDPTLTGRGMSVKVFRETYKDGFLTKFWSMLYKARNAVDSGGAELVLANRKEDVDEAFYQLYPSMRPSDDKLPAKAAKKSRSSGWTAADQKRWEQRNGAAGQAGRSAGERAASEVNVSTTSAPREVR